MYERTAMDGYPEALWMMHKKGFPANEVSLASSFGFEFLSLLKTSFWHYELWTATLS
jgi:hypothetical protein